MKLDWERGGSAVFLTLAEPDKVTLSSSVAAAPGTPLVGTNSAGVRYSVKVRTCRKLSQEPLSYWLEGRLFNVTRAMREQLELALTDSLVSPGQRDRS